MELSVSKKIRLYAIPTVSPKRNEVELPSASVKRINVSYNLAVSKTVIINFEHFLGNLYSEHFLSKNRKDNAS